MTINKVKEKLNELHIEKLIESFFEMFPTYKSFPGKDKAIDMIVERLNVRGII